MQATEFIHLKNITPCTYRNQRRFPMATLQFSPIVVTGTTGYALSLNFLSNAPTLLGGVNAAGVAFGSYRDDTGTHGIVDDNGTITVINAPGSTFTQVTGVDAAGDVSGTYHDSK